MSIKRGKIFSYLAIARAKRRAKSQRANTRSESRSSLARNADASMPRKAIFLRSNATRKEIAMSESLNDPREIDAAWNRHFNAMLISGGAQPAEAVESMLRIAALIAESVWGPQKTAATMVLAAMF